MDVRMPGTDGIEATRQVTALPEPPRVVVLTTFDLDEYVVAAIGAGASGFLLKDAPPEEMLAAIRTVHAGDSVIAASSTRRLLQHVAPMLRGAAPAAATGPRPALAELTPREREVLVQMALRREQHRDRRALRRQRGDGEDARRPGAGQDRLAGPGAGRRPRLPHRPGAARRPPPQRLAASLDPTAGMTAARATAGARTASTRSLSAPTRAGRRRTGSVITVRSLLPEVRRARPRHDRPRRAARLAGDRRRPRHRAAQDLRPRRDRRARARRRRRRVRPRRVHRDHGPVRLRQVHADALPGRPGHRHRRRRCGWAAPSSPGCATTS